MGRYTCPREEIGKMELFWLQNAILLFMFDLILKRY